MTLDAKLCSGGCQRRIPRDGPGRCPACSRARHREVDTRSQRERGFYGSAIWRQARHVFLAEHPLCASCPADGRTEPATDVDHRIPISKGGARLDPENLCSLCHRCHSAKTMRDLNTRMNQTSQRERQTVSRLNQLGRKRSP